MKKQHIAWLADTIGVLSASALTATAVSAQSRVVPGDTFSFDVVGTNPQQGRAIRLFGPQSIVFGTTQTYTYLTNQTLTVTSSEAINGLSTTDTYSFFVGDNFVPSGTQFSDGTPITGVEIDVGNSNTSGDQVNVLLPITSYTATSTLYTASDSFTYTPGVSLGTGNLSYNFFGNVYDTTGASVTPRQYRWFDFSVTYQTAATAVPEPASWAMMLVGFGLAGYGLRRRSLTAAMRAA